ncbi:MAG: protein-tyrosine phosphatase family protein [Candidatus Hodarchaeales archaeon]
MGFLYEELNFSWVIPNQLAAAALPTCRKDLEWLVNNQNIRFILSLNETPLSRQVKSFRRIRSELGFVHYHVPTIDGTGFYPHQFQKIIELFVHQKKIPMLIHCTGGYGRTSTALVAIWVSIHHLSLSEAFYKLKKIRPQVIITDIQLKSLKKWEKMYLTSNNHQTS